MSKTESEIRELIGMKCKNSSREAVAKELQVSESYLSMILNTDNPRPISKNLADSLGYTMIVATQRVFVAKDNLTEIVNNA